MKVAKGLVYQMIVSMIDDKDLQNELFTELDARPSADEHPLDDMIPVDASSNKYIFSQKNQTIWMILLNRSHYVFWEFTCYRND